MKLISHRGNIAGPNPNRENSPQYILDTIILGYDVEIDVWVVDAQLWLGHDAPQYIIQLEWLTQCKESVWIHAKNFEALNYLIDKPLRIFFHEYETHTIINNSNLIWSHDLSKSNDKSIIPLLDLSATLTHKQYPDVYGICSDFVSLIK